MRVTLTTIVFTLVLFSAWAQQDGQPGKTTRGLYDHFISPPHEAGTWVYWWWLNGYVSKEGIIRELDEFRDKGITGALIFHAGNGYTPEKVPFMSDKWREHFRFAVEEASKRGITITLNLCEGWNAGGPWVTEDHASMKLQHAILETDGPRSLDTILPDLPETRYAGDLFTYAWRKEEGNCRSGSFMDLTGYRSADGRLRWEVPEGHWVIVRFGKYVHSMGFTKLTNDSLWVTEDYFETNEMDLEGMKIHFDNTARVVIEDVRPHVGKTFTHLHIDSGETEDPDWTNGFFEHFSRLRGYDPRPYIAARAGLTVDSPEITERFLEDYTCTQGDLIIESYYGGLAEMAAQYGMGTHSEAAGYGKPTVDAIRSLGVNDITMAEFWSRSSDGYIHQLTQKQLGRHDEIRNAATAAHTYGRKIVQAEAYTCMWNLNFSTPLYDIKDVGDRAFCEGLNRTVLHNLTHQAECEKSSPGYAWPYIGVSFNVNATWWEWSGKWFNYLNRCHAMLQSGHFVADVCYFQGEWVPAYVPTRWQMDPSLPQGYDCDVVNKQVLTGQAQVLDDGMLNLPGGTRYRYLVLSQSGRWRMPSSDQLFDSNEEVPTILEWPDRASGKPLALTPETLEHILELVRQGITLVGPPPDRAIGLEGYPESDAVVRDLAANLWGVNPGSSGLRNVGNGRVIWGKKLQEIMAMDGQLPDLEYLEDEATSALPLPPQTSTRIPDPCGFDWIHRRTSDAEFYFLSNLRNEPAGGDFIFRQNPMQPELWDPLTGETRDLHEFRITGDGRISIPLKFAPRQSNFIVFRNDHEQDSHPESPAMNFPVAEEILQLEGEWTVRFDPAMKGHSEAIFPSLTDWSESEDKRIRFYSGTGVYSKEFKVKSSMMPQENARILLDLGRVEVMARVHLNGKLLGTVWTSPWQVDISPALKPGKNRMEIEVVNLWPNRMIGDRDLPPEERITRTNVTVNPEETLRPSGLLGPVILKKQTWQ